jgi:hypothetical protein
VNASLRVLVLNSFDVAPSLESDFLSETDVDVLTICDVSESNGTVTVIEIVIGILMTNDAAHVYVDNHLYGVSGCYPHRCHNRAAAHFCGPALSV